MAQVIISQLPPPPNVTGSGSSKGTDLFPATDVTATTGPNAGSGGTTNKYTLSEIYNWILESQGLKTYAATRVATTLALTAKYGSPFQIWLGATLAMIAVNALSILLGKWTKNILHEKIIKYVGAGIFIAFGLATLFHALS